MRLLILCLLVGCATRDDVLRNWNFNFWENGAPLSWEVKQGEVERVGTWHPRDYGISLVGSNVVLSQRVNDYYPCLKISVVADIADAVDVTFEIDLEDNGSVDLVQQVPKASWEPLTFYANLVYFKFTPMRFTIVKRADGHAALANMRAEQSDACTGKVFGPTGNLAEGVECHTQEACASGICAAERRDRSGFVFTCSTCARSEDCDDGQICGVVLRKDTLSSLQCMPAGHAKKDGEACNDPGECETDVCLFSCGAKPPTGHVCRGDVPFDFFQSGLPCSSNDECPFLEKCGP